MKNFKQKTLALIENNPDVKAYIYQQVLDFNPYVTPETVVAVVARESKKYPDKHRIAIILTEDDARLEAEAIHDDIFKAIELAKLKLIAKLAEIQDSVISNQDRIIEINEALTGGSNQVH